MTSYLKEAQLLSLCGLKHSDFVRFRTVERDDDKLIVSTRENGVGGRSVQAIRNPLYRASRPDDGDSTYEWYVFEVPAGTQTVLKPHAN